MAREEIRSAEPTDSKIFGLAAGAALVANLAYLLIILLLLFTPISLLVAMKVFVVAAAVGLFLHFCGQTLWTMDTIKRDLQKNRLHYTNDPPLPHHLTIPYNASNSSRTRSTSDPDGPEGV